MKKRKEYWGGRHGEGRMGRGDGRYLGGLLVSAVHQLLLSIRPGCLSCIPFLTSDLLEALLLDSLTSSLKGAGRMKLFG